MHWANKFKNNRVVFIVPEDSAFRTPLKTEFKKAGFKIYEFNYRKTVLKEKIVFGLSIPIKRLKKSGYQLINKRLLDLVKTVDPAIVFASKGETISTETIKEFKKLGMITINWYSDWFFSTPFFLQTLPEYDFVFTGDKFDTEIWRKRLNVFHLPYGGLALKAKFNFKNRKYGLVFIGTWTKGRENLLYELRDLNPIIWGNAIWAKTRLKDFYRGKLHPDKVLDTLLKTKIALNEHQGETATKTTLNFRVYEATANGAMILTDFRKDLPMLFKTSGKNQEVVLFNSNKEAHDLAKYYLDNPKEMESIAKRAFIKTTTDYNYEKRLDQIMKIVTSKKRNK